MIVGRGASTMNILKYSIVLSLLFFISGISQAQRNFITRKPISETPTDGTKSTADFSRQGRSSQANQLFSQVFTHGEFKSKYALIKSVLRGDLGCAQVLLANGVDINKEDRGIARFWSRERVSSRTPLMYAIHRNDLAMAHLLVELDVDVNYENRYAMTALMEAVENDNVEGIEFLLTFGANVNKKNKYGVTSLMIAAMNGNTNVIELLMRFGAKVDLQSESGTTALILAAGLGHLEAVRLLLSFDANVDLRDKKGWTALMSAAFGTYSITAPGAYVKITNILKESGATMTEEDKQKTS